MSTIELPKSGASLNRHRSFQAYRTPADFVEAVTKRFGPLYFDLAADQSNSLCGKSFFSEDENSLDKNWSVMRGNLWLNPPFNDIAPWAKKCMEESFVGATILFLVPASVGSNWFAKYVYGKAAVFFLRPRLSFNSLQPYPKDCILCEFGPIIAPNFRCWRWK